MAWGLAQVANSIFAGLSVTGTSDEMGLGESPSGRECFLLVDGLGLDAVEKYGFKYDVFQLRQELLLSQARHEEEDYFNNKYEDLIEKYNRLYSSIYEK